MRCHLETVDASGKCRRCFASDKVCVFTILPPRKPRRRTDARVTSLENELNAMKDHFSRLQHGQDQMEATPPNSEADKSTPSGSQNMTSSSTSPPEVSDNTPLPWLDSVDLDEGMARQLFTEYKQILMPEFPLVVIPEVTTFDELKQKSPTLLLATVTAASSAHQSELFSTLHSRLTQVVLNKAMIRGEKSLELIEAIEILVGWFCPPDDIKFLNFYQYIHLAATMALELGLVGATQDEPAVVTTCKHNTRTKRLALAVYHSCSSSAMSLRRRNILHATSDMRRSLKILAVSPDIMDQRLAALVELQLIAETADELRSTPLDEESAAENVVLRIQEVEQQFESWEHGLAANVKTGSLMSHYHFSRSKLFEAALRNCRGVSSLVPPYLPLAAGPQGENDILTWTEERAALLIGGEYHAIMQTCLAAPPETLRRYPTVNYARVAHATKGLFALRGVLKQGQGGRGSNMIDTDIVLSMREHLDVTAGASKCRVPAKFSWLLGTISKAASKERDVENKTLNTDRQPESWSLSAGYFGMMDEDHAFSFNAELHQPIAMPFESALPGDHQQSWKSASILTSPRFQDSILTSITPSGARWIVWMLRLSVDASKASQSWRGKVFLRTMRVKYLSARSLYALLRNAGKIG